jgi:putative ABC transport system permease protein
MFKNYLKTALRNLKRNKGYALINTLGLAVGIAACLLIVLVLQFETSFDNFHSKKNHIYRVGSEFHTQDGVDYSAGSCFPTGPALRLDFPQLKQVAQIFKRGNDQVTIENDGKEPKKFLADVYYAEPEFFNMFDFAWLYGDAKTTLTQPASAALTQEVAEKYFGDWHSAIGKTIKYSNDNKQVYKINGILKNIPVNTDFPLGIVVSFSTLHTTWIEPQMSDWVSTFGAAYTFITLSPDLSKEKFNSLMPAFSRRHKPADYAKDTYIAQPLADIHYDDRFGNYGDHFFSRSLVTALTLIGIFLIIIACVNFVNLATAQAVNRSKEVGVRKVLGSTRKQLALQFLGETALITIASIFAALLIASAALPFLSKLLEVHIKMNLINSPALILFLVIVFIMVTFLSGFYPALVLSGFNPITALKSKVSTSTTGGISLRRGLVILQFVIAHILIIGTLIVVSQMNYFRNAALGFDKAQIINVDVPADSISHMKMDYLKNRLVQNPSIKNVSYSYRGPSSEGNWNSDLKFDHDAKNTNFSANLKWADGDYFKTFNIQFVAGRPYYPSDTVKEFVVNETFMKKVGVTKSKDGIGKQLNFWDGKKVGPIVGVIRDFNSFSLRQPMAPVVLSTWKEVYQTINIKLKPGDEKQVLAFVEKEWTKAFPDYVYKYEFLDETINNFYKQEGQLSQLYKIFAAIAIFISCIGLYGLVSFMVVQRTKEVGIRKVLGANVANIVYLLSKEFTFLIIIAFAIAGPVAYYIMHKWLQNYSYRIELGASIFLISIISSIVIAWITVGHRAIKAALANPVKSLRTE